MAERGRAEPLRSRTFRSRSEEDTRALGLKIGALLRPGDLIGLLGELGAGKTCLVRGIAEGLGVPPRKVRSPTFTLLAEYSDSRLPLYHLDLYRLDLSDVDRLALREYVYGDGVCIIEWFERLLETPPRLEVSLTFVGANERTLVVSAFGERYDALLADLENGV